MIEVICAGQSLLFLISVASFLVLGGGGGGARLPKVPTKKFMYMYMYM